MTFPTLTLFFFWQFATAAAADHGPDAADPPGLDLGPVWRGQAAAAEGAPPVGVFGGLDLRVRRVVEGKPPAYREQQH